MDSHIALLHFKIRKSNALDKLRSKNALDKHELVAVQEGHIALVPHC